MYNCFCVYTHLTIYILSYIETCSVHTCIYIYIHLYLHIIYIYKYLFYEYIRIYVYIYTPFYIQTHVYAYYVRICIYYIYIIRIFDMFATFSSRKIWKPRSEPWTLRRPVSVPSVAWRRRARRSDTEWYKGNKVCVCVYLFFIILLF